MEVTNRHVSIKKSIENGKPNESDFEIQSSTLCLSATPGSNEVVLKNLYVSIDPYQVNRMKSHTSLQNMSIYSAALTPGNSIEAYGVAKVVSSANGEFEEGDLVVGMITWGDYCVLEGDYMLRKFDTMGFPLSHHVGIFASSGLTAYAGFFEVCKAKKGENVFVSAASGSIGHFVGQYAKQFGCYVVGCTGSNEKAKMLKQEFGFDEAFNYKEETDLKSTLKRYFPSGIDIYFDNVGGEMLEASIENMNVHGRIAACGVISEYTNNQMRYVPNMLDIIYKRITIRGFLTADFMDLYPEFISATVEPLHSGSLKTLEDIYTGLESIPSAFVGLFKGGNAGKKMVKLANE